MLSITSLATRLASDFPQFTFSESDTFRWNPTEDTVYYDSSSDDAGALLHELSHALLSHTAYTRDVSLLRIETEAWHLAATRLSRAYQVDILEDTIQDALDTYRDWLHARSTCPHCQATGVQAGQYVYRCLACESKWKVNEARTCALRRSKKHP